MFEKFVNLLSNGGLPLIFILIFLEGNPIVGSFVPGQILVIMVGFLIATFDLFNIYYAFIIIMIAGILGDYFGFYLGKKYGFEGMKKCGLDNKSQIYKYSRKFFKKFDSWSIILGREFNITRSFMPFFAGICNMDTKKFVFLAFISNILWSSLSLALGYYFGFIVIDRIEFIFGFITFLLIYLSMLFFIYISFRKLYNKNYFFIKRYALINIGISLTLSLILTIFIIFRNFNVEEYFNSIFSIFYFPILSNTIAFLPSLNTFLGLFIWFIIAFFLIFPIKNKIRIFISLISGFVLSFFMTLIISVLMKKWFDFYPYISIIFLTISLFFISILLVREIKSKKILLILNLILISILFFIFLVKFAITQNIYMVFLSFFIATIECELIVVMSHYRIIDTYFSKLDEILEY